MTYDGACLGNPLDGAACGQGFYSRVAHQEHLPLSYSLAYYKVNTYHFMSITVLDAQLFTDPYPQIFFNFGSKIHLDVDQHCE